MNSNFDDLLSKRYPVIFRDRHASRQKTAMCWGFACGDGWYPLIDTLCAEIQRHVDATNSQPVIAVQVKEKFGTLRFYTTGGDEYTRGLIWLAGSLSAVVCEDCGAPALISGRSWILTRCADHGGVEFPLDQSNYCGDEDEPDDVLALNPEKLVARELAKTFRLPPTRTRGWRHIAHALAQTIRNDLRHNSMPRVIIVGSDESEALSYEWLGGDDRGRLAAMLRLAEAYAALCDRRTGKPAA